MKIDIVVDEPKRILIKPSEKATDYFSYCEEVGCEVWMNLRGYHRLMNLNLYGYPKER